MTRLGPLRVTNRCVRWVADMQFAVRKEIDLGPILDHVERALTEPASREQREMTRPLTVSTYATPDAASCATDTPSLA